MKTPLSIIVGINDYGEFFIKLCSPIINIPAALPGLIENGFTVPQDYDTHDGELLDEPLDHPEKLMWLNLEQWSGSGWSGASITEGELGFLGQITVDTTEPLDFDEREPKVLGLDDLIRLRAMVSDVLPGKAADYAVRILYERCRFFPDYGQTASALADQFKEMRT